jgi:hypothetical protein
VIKPGGRFAVADIVMTKIVPDEMLSHIALWTGCIAGALHVDEYKAKLEAAGFTNMAIEVARIYTASDAEGLFPAQVMETIGREKVADLADSFVSAFVRAVKPR